MDRTALLNALRMMLAERADRLGIATGELHGRFDLVRSGLLDSLGFVDLITGMEQVAGREVDLSTAFDRPGSTTVDGVLDLLMKG